MRVHYPRSPISLVEVTSGKTDSRTDIMFDLASHFITSLLVCVTALSALGIGLSLLGFSICYALGIYFHVMDKNRCE